jgi:hypothetical protein
MVAAIEFGMEATVKLQEYKIQSSGRTSRTWWRYVVCLSYQCVLITCYVLMAPAKAPWSLRQSRQENLPRPRDSWYRGKVILTPCLLQPCQLPSRRGQDSCYRGRLILTSCYSNHVSFIYSPSRRPMKANTHTRLRSVWSAIRSVQLRASTYLALG